MIFYKIYRYINRFFVFNLKSRKTRRIDLNEFVKTHFIHKTKKTIFVSVTVSPSVIYN